jgi:hypothetical protein
MHHPRKLIVAALAVSAGMTLYAQREGGRVDKHDSTDGLTFCTDGNKATSLMIVTVTYQKK